MVSCSVSCERKKKGWNSFISMLPVISAISALLMVLSDMLSSTGMPDFLVLDLIIPSMLLIFCHSVKDFTKRQMFYPLLTVGLAVAIMIARLSCANETPCGRQFMEYVPAVLSCIMLVFLFSSREQEVKDRNVRELHHAVFFVILLGCVYHRISEGNFLPVVLSCLSVMFYAHLYTSVVRRPSGVPAGVLKNASDASGPSARTAEKENRLNGIYLRLQELFEAEKPYLDENITVADVARRLYTNKAYLSRAINDNTGKNFCQYVNHYRVKYSMQIFKENQDLRVSELAEMSGFHTMVSYNMAFRLVTGESPSEWCRRTRFENSL